MAAGSTPNYDAYISVSDSLQDKEWFDSVLKKPLLDAGVRFRTNDDLGAPVEGETPDSQSDLVVEAIAQAIQDSRFTLFLLTPDWLATGRGAFENALAKLQDPHGNSHYIIPIWLSGDKIPDTLKIYTTRDMRRATERDKQIQILIGRLLSFRIRDQDTTTLPPPRRLVQILWLKLRGSSLEHPIRAALLSVLLLVLFSALVGFPSAEGWQRINRQDLTWHAETITRIGDTLFVMTSTNDACKNDLDTGLWKSTDQGVNWERKSVPLDFQTAKGCERATIQSIVAAPDDPQVLYAATSNVGILKSIDNGDTWHPLNADPERLQLAALAVLSSPARIYVAGNVALTWGLYRSTDGQQWERLDTPERCPPSPAAQSGPGKEPPLIPLPSVATVNAALVTVENVLYIAPLDTSEIAPAPVLADIYFSKDGGNCWRSIHTTDSNGKPPVGRINFSMLAAIPGKPNEILFGTWGDVLGRKIWRRNWETGDQQLLGELPLSGSQLLVTDGGEQWYAATLFGYLMRGKVRQFDNPARLLGPFTLYASYALDFDNHSPLLLSGGNVFRRGTVGWWQTLLP